MPDIQPEISGIKLEEIASFRALFLQEGNFSSFIINAMAMAGQTLSFCTGWHQGRLWSCIYMNKREERDTIFEFYLTWPFRKYASFIFREFCSVSKAIFAKCQRNDPLLSSMAFEYAKGINAGATL